MNTINIFNAFTEFLSQELDTKYAERLVHLANHLMNSLSADGYSGLQFAELPKLIVKNNSSGEEIHQTEKVNVLSGKERKNLFSLSEGSKVDSKLLYRFARSIEWSCHDLRCWTCDEGQRWQCLLYFRKEWKNRLRHDDLVSGIPYEKPVLEKLPRTYLSILMGALKINPFALPDKSSKGVIIAILIAQKNYKRNGK